MVEIRTQDGSLVTEGMPLVLLRTDVDDSELASLAAAEGASGIDERMDLSVPRSDLAKVLERRYRTTDASRAESEPDRYPARRDARRAKGLRTARENIEALVDAESFLEYGRFALAAQQQRTSMDELITRTPADGLVTGTALINSSVFGPAYSTACVMAYDALVLAGTQVTRAPRGVSGRTCEACVRARSPTHAATGCTRSQTPPSLAQGFYNHMKLDRMLDDAAA